MKAYLVVYGYSDGYSDDYEFDSVFLNKEEAEAYVEENNRIPYDEQDELHIVEVELNASTPDKKFVIVHGYITEDKEIQALEIGRIDRESLEALKKFTEDDIILRPGKIYNVGDVTFFDGRIDVTSCKDLEKCDQYIKDTIMKKLEHYNQKDNDDKELE